MSKYDSIRKAESTAATEARLSSLRQLRRDFESSQQNQPMESYDRRVYFDGMDEYYPYMFSKTLSHNMQTGFPKKVDVDKVIDATLKADKKSIANIPKHSGSVRTLEGIASASSFCLMGNDSTIPFLDGKRYPIDSVEGMFEMAEVYGMSLLRDISFSQYQTKYDEMSSDGGYSEFRKVVDNLNKFPTNTSAPVNGNNTITPQNVFRGSGMGETYGPYISQFLLLPYKYGNLHIEQKYTSEDDVKGSVSLDSQTSNNWFDIQNGKQGSGNQNTVLDTDGSPKSTYTNNARVLGAKVHNDPLYQFYYQATLIAFGNGIKPDTFESTKTTAWTTGGGPDVLGSVAGVAIGALRTAWYHKWSVNMHIRPEVMAQRITFAKKNPTMVNNIPGMVNALKLAEDYMPDILTSINSKCTNYTDSAEGDLYMLPLMFQEGSPTHPSFPAGHATVSGACCTVLKAMLKTHDHATHARLPWVPEAKISSDDGSILENYQEDDRQSMTIVGELNKLASNVAIGRNWAGVHYRCDGDCGMELGQQYAISYLIDKCKEYHESITDMFEGFVLEKFDGSIVRITSNGVVEL